jgi:Tfp pilus assembly protein FimT
MVVIGILAGTAVVSLSSTTANRAGMAAKQLQRDLTFARQRAVATGTRSWVEFEVDFQDELDRWTVKVEQPATPGRANALVLNDPATHSPFVQTLGRDQFVGVNLTTVDFDGDVWIGFDWLGRPLDKPEVTPLAAEGNVVLTDGHTVTVEKETGHIAYVSP